MAKQAHQVYHAFLVRCWLVSPETIDEPALWRFELREVPAEERKHRFGDLEGVKNFMSAELAAIATGSNRDSDGEDK